MATSSNRVFVLLWIASFAGLNHVYAGVRSISTDVAGDSNESEGVVKTIEDKDYGILIDCIDIYKQPALSNPLLRNHTIQMKPTSVYRTRGTEKKSKGEPPIYQNWWKYGECPQGTIPMIRRDGQTYNQINARRSLQVRVRRNPNGPEFKSPPGLEVAEMSAVNGSYTAAHAFLNVWEPNVTDDSPQPRS